MKSNKTFLIFGLTLAVISFSGILFAASQTGATTVKVNNKSVTTSTTEKAKLTEADIDKIVVKLYKDAKILEVKLVGKIYTVKIHTAKGNRMLEIGANTGKILNNIGAVGATTVKNASEAVTPTPINVSGDATPIFKIIDTPIVQAPTPTITPATN